MPEITDLTGQKFGRLTVTGLSASRLHGRLSWDCLCDCGTIVTIIGKSLRYGETKSCGCYNADMVRIRCTKHGKTSSYLWKTWQGMKARCYNSNNTFYHCYGARGIKVCDRWLGEDGFTNFYNDMGERPSDRHTLDRHPNINGDYEPNNCRWATPKEQQNNRRNNHIVYYNGIRYTLMQASEKFNIKCTTLRARLKYGWDIQKALNISNG